MSAAPRVGVVAALHQELAAVLARLPHERRQQVGGRDFWLGDWHGHELVAVLARVGKVAAATTATILIERFGVDRIIFTGTAGGLAPGVAVGDLVVARSFLQHDLDASPLFPRHEVPLYGQSRFAADSAMTAALAAAARAVLAQRDVALGPQALQEFELGAARVHEGLLLSGDRFIATAQASQALRAELPDALAVEMEGAAVAQVCHDYGLPFAAVRTISDRADDSAHVDFMRFVQRVASRYSVAVLAHYFRAMPAREAMMRGCAAPATPGCSG